MRRLFPQETASLLDGTTAPPSRHASSNEAKMTPIAMPHFCPWCMGVVYEGEATVSDPNNVEYHASRYAELVLQRKRFQRQGKADDRMIERGED